MRHIVRSALAVAALLVGITAQGTTIKQCGALNELKLPDVTQVEAASVPAGAFVAPGLDAPLPGGDLPAFCRVKLTVAPKINIEIWLPEKDWNKRYHGRGVGGLGGVIAYQDLAQALRAGYATAATDTGHASTDRQWPIRADGSVDMQALEDYGWRSLHEMALKAKAVIKAYYGTSPRYSYFSGCSGGGRQGLVTVQRFPREYDGVLVGCAPNALNRELATFLWPQVVMRERLGRPIASDKLRALTAEVVKACDGIDGVRDGLINDPRKCTYDPAELSCDRNETSVSCLTSKEVDAIRAIWDGPRSKKTGERLWFTVEKTVYSAMWEEKPYRIGLEHLKWVTGDTNADWTKLTEENFEAYLERAIEKLGGALDADNPDLSEFVRGGGKLLLWHGDGDWGDPSRDSINYFYRVREANRGSSDLDAAIRLFLLPDVGHCRIDFATRKASNAPFPSEPTLEGSNVHFPDGLFNALVTWVETGIAPERIIASQKLATGAIRTRPLCAFPKVAKWKGRGDTDAAENFDCVDGTQNRADFTTKYDSP